MALPCVFMAYPATGWECFARFAPMIPSSTLTHQTITRHVAQSTCNRVYDA